MNYRHIFHAGNICDTVKHTVLTLLIARLREKDAGFCVLDTHAGIGLYDLHDERALKTKEAQGGIFKLLNNPLLTEFGDFYAILQKLNPGWTPDKGTDGFHFYPGSPLLAFHMLRPQDRLIACELHEDDARKLKRLFYNDAQVHVHHRNGYEALQAFTPPTEKRGLVLIDPPYELTNEFEKLVKEITQAHRHWPQGLFTLWYPVKERPAIWRFHDSLAAIGIPKMLCAEFMFEDETRQDRLNGSGLILINPPWQMDEKLRGLFATLQDALQPNHRSATVKWLTTE